MLLLLYSIRYCVQICAAALSFMLLVTPYVTRPTDFVLSNKKTSLFPPTKIIKFLPEITIFPAFSHYYLHNNYFCPNDIKKLRNRFSRFIKIGQHDIRTRTLSLKHKQLSTNILQNCSWLMSLWPFLSIHQLSHLQRLHWTRQKCNHRQTIDSASIWHKGIP